MTNEASVRTSTLDYYSHPDLLQTKKPTQANNPTQQYDQLILKYQNAKKKAFLLEKQNQLLKISLDKQNVKPTNERLQSHEVKSLKQEVALLRKSNESFKAEIEHLEGIVSKQTNEIEALEKLNHKLNNDMQDAAIKLNTINIKQDMSKQDKTVQILQNQLDEQMKINVSLAQKTDQFKKLFQQAQDRYDTAVNSQNQTKKNNQDYAFKETVQQKLDLLETKITKKDWIIAQQKNGIKQLQPILAELQQHVQFYDTTTAKLNQLSHAIQHEINGNTAVPALVANMYKNLHVQILQMHAHKFGGKPPSPAVYAIPITQNETTANSPFMNNNSIQHINAMKLQIQQLQSSNAILRQEVKEKHDINDDTNKSPTIILQSQTTVNKTSELNATMDILQSLTNIVKVRSVKKLKHLSTKCNKSNASSAIITQLIKVLLNLFISQNVNASNISQTKHKVLKLKHNLSSVRENFRRQKGMFFYKTPQILIIILICFGFQAKFTEK